MARLTNSPQQQLSFDLERRKSYSFRCVLLYADRTPLDLTGCTVRFVVKDAEFDDDMFDSNNHLVNTEGVISTPLTGEAVFSFQAAELDAEPGEYYYSIVLWTADGFSVTIVKGIFSLHPNTESLSMTKSYSSGTADAALELTLRGMDLVNIVTNTLTRDTLNTLIVGTGRPDDPSTLEATTLAAVASAAPPMMFISTDGNNEGLWAWRRRAGGWAVVEQDGLDWNSMANLPESFPPSEHTHTLGSLSDVETPVPQLGQVLGWNGTTWAPIIVGSGGGGVTDHGALSGLSDDDHVMYAKADGSRGAFAPTVHTHSIGNVTGLQTALDGKSATGHGHSIGDTTGLQTALDGKASSSHAHSLDSLTDVVAAAPVTGDVVRFNGTEWAPYQLPRMWSGEANGGQWTGPAFYNMTVTFPAGRFTAVFRVFAQINNQAGGGAQLQVLTTAITSTQCTVGFFLSTGGTLNAHWCVADIFAIQDV